MQKVASNQVRIVEFTNGERKLQDVESGLGDWIMSVRERCRSVTVVLACALLSAPAWGADPGQREVQRNQQLRQQQQEDLQLRMQQYQRAVQSPPGDVRQQQSLRQLEIEQRQRQQQLHQRQNIETPQPAPQADDEGTQRAKAQIEQQRMQQERLQQLQRFDADLQQRAEQGKSAAPVNRSPLPAAGEGSVVRHD